MTNKNSFISHSSPDDRYVAELVQLVRSLGYVDVFNDSHTIEPDAQFWPRIEQGIRDCDAFVVVLSHASVGSYWVDQEVQFARDLEKRIIPVRIDDCKLPKSFDGRDVIDLRQGRGDKVKIASSRILRHSPSYLFGREPELAALDEVWNSRTHINVYSLIAWGGAGKTSLVAHWVAQRFVAQGWAGVERYFDWSFYSQGTRETSQVGADFFIAEALKFFGDPEPQFGSPWDRGQRLANLVRQHRTLLVLDGMEPLQYPPNSPQAGELKDEALTALLQGLAMDNPGLCVITSREALKNIETYHGKTTEETKLHKLTRAAAISLLRHLQIAGTDEEIEAAWKDAGGHALTLQLLGRFLADAHGGDIRKRKEIHFTDLDRETPGRTAMKVMLAYETWLASAGPDRQRDLAVLRVMGLFDRPASPGCLQALRSEPVIEGLTGELVGIQDWQWTKALKDLTVLDLVTVSPNDPDLFPDDPNATAFQLPVSVLQVDAHPLVRVYFAEQLRTKSADAFRSAHSRLFDYLCESTEHQPDTLPGLQPLYQAVTHGCLAGRHQEACDKVYYDRIQRGTEAFSSRKLGAIGADLGAVASFFDQPWSVLSPNLSEADQAWLLNEAAFRLRALGRLTEAVEPMRVATERVADAENWKQAAAGASNVSELELTLGLVSAAVSDGRRSIEYADLSEDAGQRMINRTTAADALHQQGSRAESLELFAQAEQMQAKRQPQFPLLYSLQGFQYVDLLLSPAERAAWQCRLSLRERTSGLSFAERKATIKACHESIRRATQTLEWVKTAAIDILSIALDHLTLARASLYLAILQSEPSELPSDLDLEQNQAEPAVSAVGSQDAMITQHPDFLNATNELQQALSGLQQAGTTHHVPKALLTAAMLHSLQGPSGVEQAFAHLAEAEQTATRGPMPLFLADIHLTRARLAGSLKGEGENLKVDASTELKEARRLIEKHNYSRRIEELQDAEVRLSSQPN